MRVPAGVCTALRGLVRAVSSCVHGAAWASARCVPLARTLPTDPRLHLRLPAVEGVLLSMTCELRMPVLFMRYIPHLLTTITILLRWSPPLGLAPMALCRPVFAFLLLLYFLMTL